MDSVVDMLAGRMEKAIVPLINMALTYMDKITEFLQTSVAPYAKKAKEKLPQLREYLKQFVGQVRAFAGIVEDILNVARGIIAKSSPEFANLNASANTAQQMVSTAVPVMEYWHEKLLGWIDMTQNVLTMVENADAQMLFKMVSDLFEMLGLPGQKIMVCLSLVYFQF